MRRYGAFEVKQRVGQIYDEPVDPEELEDIREDARGRVFTRAAKPASPNVVPVPSPDGDEEGRRLVGVRVGDEIKRGFPTPSGRLEFYSRTLVRLGLGVSLHCRPTSRATSILTTSKQVKRF